MYGRVLFFVAFFSVLAFSLVPLFASAHSLLIPNENIATSTLVSLANVDRAHTGLSPLRASTALMRAAQEKAEDMAAQGYFAHTSPTGVTPWYWLTKVGYPFRFAGENLAVYFSRSEDVEGAWMASPEHRANILSTDYSEIGIGYATGIYDDVETTFVVEMFGTE